MKIEDELDMARFAANVEKHFPPSSLSAYRGQHVAYNADGTAIVASAAEASELYERLRTLGIPLSRAPIAWIPGDDLEARLG